MNQRPRTGQGQRPARRTGVVTTGCTVGGGDCRGVGNGPGTRADGNPPPVQGGTVGVPHAPTELGRWRTAIYGTGVVGAGLVAAVVARRLRPVPRQRPSVARATAQRRRPGRSVGRWVRLRTPARLEALVQSLVDRVGLVLRLPDPGLYPPNEKNPGDDQADEKGSDKTDGRKGKERKDRNEGNRAHIRGASRRASTPDLSAGLPVGCAYRSARRRGPLPVRWPGRGVPRAAGGPSGSGRRERWSVSFGRARGILLALPIEPTAQERPPVGQPGPVVPHDRGELFEVVLAELPAAVGENDME